MLISRCPPGEESPCTVTSVTFINSLCPLQLFLASRYLILLAVMLLRSVLKVISLSLSLGLSLRLKLSFRSC